LEHEDHEDILEDFGLLLCCSYLCSEAWNDIDIFNIFNKE
jgi:hypothetical protein